MKICASLASYYDGLVDDTPQNYTYDSQRGAWIGNPSKAKKVVQYMKSLNKRKAKAGVKAKSVRAITQEDIMAFYARCVRIDTAVSAHQYCIYVFAFLALLRIEEALSLQLTSI